MTKLNVALVWWRQVQLGEFYNIERKRGSVAGGGGALYIEIPGTLVADTLEFLAGHVTDGEATISAYTIGPSEGRGQLEFRRKTGNRLRIANQNRQASPESRHPAWRHANGFPKAPDDVASSQEAKQYLPSGGLKIYIVRTVEGDFYAGFVAGPLPRGMLPSEPMYGLWSNRIGGLIRA